jgi:hypothetical protein
MNRYFYLSLTPEALIVSMLPPNEFGTYMAVGTQKKSRGQAIFFEIDPDVIQNQLNRDYIEKRCVPHKNGEPKRSVYLSIYRVLETISLKAIKNLYLATNDGRVLELSSGKYVFPNDTDRTVHLYQELGPAYSRVASHLNPVQFLNYLTDPSQPIYVPKLVFVELTLENLATDPEHGSDDDLPYSNIDHLRDCLILLKMNPEKLTKTIVRNVHSNIPYRTCRNGFFIGSKDGFLYFRYPGPQELNEKYHTWWRSATTVFLNE